MPVVNDNSIVKNDALKPAKALSESSIVISNEKGFKNDEYKPVSQKTNKIKKGPAISFTIGAPPK